jgi:formylglycine-generating enzyme
MDKRCEMSRVAVVGWYIATLGGRVVTQGGRQVVGGGMLPRAPLWMRRRPVLLVLASPLVATACASLIGFPDVPDVADSGVGNGGGSGLGSGGGSSAESTSSGLGSSTSASSSGSGDGSSGSTSGSGAGSSGSTGGSGADSSGTSGLSSGSGSSSSSGSGSSSGGSGGCIIGATAYAAGTTNQANACESCQPSLSASAWSDTADGTPCGSGDICYAGACVSGCEIGGAYYAPSVTNPNDACQSCQPGVSTGTWSDGADGSTCDAGTCSSGSCSAAPPSCAVGGAGVADCGASSESCCTSLAVAGGTYDRTYTNSGTGATGLADPATISSFRMDKYLVTVGRFRQFVAAWNGGNGYTPPAGSGKHAHLNGGMGLAATGGGYEPGWVVTDNGNIAPTDTNLTCGAPLTDPTWTSSAGAQETLPINCVNWYEAYAFCIWDGGFLPSEAEWEYATAAGSKQREYPWGTAAPGTSNQYAIYDVNYTANATQIAPVGTATLGAGYWGQLDLAGEVWEWNLDWYATYAPCTDCAAVTPGTSRVFRGGDFGDTAEYLLPPHRTERVPTGRGTGIGLRCARTP